MKQFEARSDFREMALPPIQKRENARAWFLTVFVLPSDRLGGIFLCKSLRVLCLSILLLMFIGPTQLLADSPLDLLQSANQLYEAERFGEAQILYQQLVNQGIRDSVVFYNLGNAYFKLDQLGQAILNYRLAQTLDPRDEDIQANLALARSQTLDKIEGNSEALMGQWVDIIQTRLTLNELAWLSLGLWILMTLLLIAYTQIRQWGLADWHKIKPLYVVRYMFIVSVVVFFGCTISFGSWLYSETIRPQGVIIVDEVDVTSGPGPQYIIEFTLHNGTEVGLLEARNHWYRLTLPGQQLQGWVPARAIGLVHK